MLSFKTKMQSNNCIPEGIYNAQTLRWYNDYHNPPKSKDDNPLTLGDIIGYCCVLCFL